MNTLVVINSPENCFAIVENLRFANFNVIGVHNLVTMNAQLQAGVWDAVLLGLEMPGIDQNSLVRELRKQYGERLGIFIIDGQNDFELRLQALKSGADAYLSKPVMFAELEAILGRHFARTYADTLQQERQASTDSGKDSNGNWVLQQTDLMLSYVKDGTRKSIRLTGAESRILSKLMDCPKQTVGRSELCSQLGPGGDPTETRRLDTLLSRLRNKVNKATGLPLPITTYRNLGFVFNGECHAQNPTYTAVPIKIVEVEAPSSHAI